MEFTASGDNGQGQDTLTPLSGWWLYEKKTGSGRGMEVESAESMHGDLANSNLLETGTSNEEEDGPTNREEVLQLERRARLQEWAAIKV